MADPNGNPGNDVNNNAQAVVDQPEDDEYDDEQMMAVDDPEDEVLPVPVAQVNGQNVEVKLASCFRIKNPNLPVLEGRSYTVTWDGGNDALMNRPDPNAPSSSSDKNANNGGGSGSDAPGIWNRFCSMFTGGGDGNTNQVAHGGGGGGGDANNPGGNNQAQLSHPHKIRFADCGGLENQINFIRSAIFGPLSGITSDEYKRFGLVPPKGILFHGPPGTGKTRLAQAISNELSEVIGQPVHFIYRKGNDIASKYFGQSSKNLRKVFAEAERMKPTVLFFDELDGLCPSRDRVRAAEMNNTIVTSMLGLMDQLPRGEVFVFGATNMVETIDPALRRPGRFDKHLEFLPPSEKGRLDILGIHTKQWKKQPTADILQMIATNSVGFTGADLSKLCLDAFDNALDRAIKEQEGIFDDDDNEEGDAAGNYGMRFDPDSLQVRCTDWSQALEKTKPKTSTIFGSILYTPTTQVETHVEPLLHTNLCELRNKAIQLLPCEVSSNNLCQDFPILHIWSDSKSLFENMEEYMMAPLFQSHALLSDIPKYCLSSEALLSVSWRDWGRKLERAFSQAVNSQQPSILYIPEVHEFWQVVKAGGGALGMQLHNQLETLRGSKVLLVTTACCHPTDLELDSPFRLVCSTHSRTFKVAPPTEVEREIFFTTFLQDNVPVEKWSDQEKEGLRMMKDRMVQFTQGIELGMILGMYDNLKNSLTTAPAPLNCGEVIGLIATAISQCEMQLAAMRSGRCTCSDGNNNNGRGGGRCGRPTGTGGGQQEVQSPALDEIQFREESFSNGRIYMD